MSSHSAIAPSEAELHDIMDSIREWSKRQTEHLAGSIANQTRIINELESELTDLQNTLEQALATNDKIKEQNAKLQSRLNQTELGIKYDNLLEAYNMAELEIKELKAKIKSLESRGGQSAATAPATAPTPACTCPHSGPKVHPNLFDVLVKEFLNPSRNDYVRGC